MTSLAALRQLGDVLARENAALAALDLAAAGRFTAEKAAALAACDGAPAAEHLPTLRAVVAAAQENRQRLEYALAVQARIIALIARAAPTADRAGRYGPPRRAGSSAQALWARA